MPRSISLFLATALVVLGFHSLQAQDPKPAPSGPHELLNATLWVQKSAEWRGLCHQAYTGARAQLDKALKTPAWTAALEQTSAFEKLPPAVILDVDETVLDNSYYEARLIRDGGSYGPKTWDAWCKEATATPIPGALEFCQYAHKKGATVFYVTNRKSHLREATRKNLVAQGFPMREGVETVRTRDKQRDKGPRRIAIAKEYRILLLVGDNGSDFCSPLLAETNAETRAVADKHSAWWGGRWILLPNPMYGHWEANAVKRRWGARNEALRQHLRREALVCDPKK
jgi:5'-nucleotidase (lipoprotein e(P4) family)